jgi:hypothetical protein
MKEIFNLSKPLPDVFQACLENFQNLYFSETQFSSSIPYVQIGTYGIFTLSVRYAYRVHPSWGYMLKSEFMPHMHKGYATIDQAIDGGIQNAIKWYNEFYSENPELRIAY